MSDFPSSPAVDEEFTTDGVTWKWDGSDWVPEENPDNKLLGDRISLFPGQVNTENIANGSITSAKLNTELATTSVASTPPASASEGDMWCDSSDGSLYIYYDSFWIQITTPQSYT